MSRYKNGESALANNVFQFTLAELRDFQVTGLRSSNVSTKVHRAKRALAKRFHGREADA